MGRGGLFGMTYGAGRGGSSRRKDQEGPWRDNSPSLSVSKKKQRQWIGPTGVNQTGEEQLPAGLGMGFGIPGGGFRVWADCSPLDPGTRALDLVSFWDITHPGDPGLEQAGTCFTQPLSGVGLFPPRCRSDPKIPIPLSFPVSFHRSSTAPRPRGHGGDNDYAQPPSKSSQLSAYPGKCWKRLLPAPFPWKRIQQAASVSSAALEAACRRSNPPENSSDSDYDLHSARRV